MTSVIAFGLIPVPARGRDTVAMLEVIEMLDESGPAACGVIVTLIVQLAFGTNVAGQVLIWLKLAALFPPEGLAIVRVVRFAVPVLVRVTTGQATGALRLELPQATDVGDKLTTGAVLIPVPVSVVADDPPVKDIERLAEFDCATVGEN